MDIRRVGARLGSFELGYSGRRESRDDDALLLRSPSLWRPQLIDVWPVLRTMLDSLRNCETEKTEYLAVQC